MDMTGAKKAYNPDQEGRREAVLVGLSGGIKSFVTASLLKIQKYEVIGVTVQNDPLGFQGPSDKFLKCHPGDQKLDEIRLFCRSLGIPHFVVKSGPEFQETVVENWKSSRIEGSLGRQCRLCHVLRMRILHREMLRLGATRLATGHLGKIFLQNESVFLRSSNDETNDQSGLLSELPEVILKSLLLPLSDLQYAEILRLAENFALKQTNGDLKECFPDTEVISGFLEKTVPPGLSKPGSMILKNGDKFEDHEGVLGFVFGKSVTPKDKQNEHVFIDYDYHSRDILLGDSSDFLTDDFFIESENLSDSGSLLEPVPGYLRLEGTEVECWISPKSHQRIHVQLNEKKKVLTGQTLSIFKKPGRNSRLLVTGIVSSPKYAEAIEDEDSDEKSGPSSTLYIR